MPQLEFHQLDRRLEHLRVRHQARFRRLLASLAETGQQTPIVVIPQGQLYLVIDGHQRIAALGQLRRDTVDAAVWEMSESDALVLARSLRMNSEPETALEQGWLLAEMESRLDCSIEALARRFDRSPTWVAGRLALVDTLPATVQQQVREGRIAPQIAMRYLAPAARADPGQCERLADIFAQRRWTTRQAAALYHAWRDAKTKQTRERILANPELYLKTQQQPGNQAKPTLESDLDQIAAIAKRALHREEPTPGAPPDKDAMLLKIQHATRLLEQLARQIERTGHAEPIATGNDSGTARQASEQARDREASEPVEAECAQGPRRERHGSAEDRAGRESRAISTTDPRVVSNMQGESRASP